jgi:hypothetical protein
MTSSLPHLANHLVLYSSYKRRVTVNHPHRRTQSDNVIDRSYDPQDSACVCCRLLPHTTGHADGIGIQGSGRSSTTIEEEWLALLDAFGGYYRGYVLPALFHVRHTERTKLAIYGSNIVKFRRANEA